MLEVTIVAEYMRRLHKIFLAMLIAFTMVGTVATLGSPIQETVLAEGTCTASDGATGEQAADAAAYAAVSDKEFTTEDGTSVKGKDLFTGCTLNSKSAAKNTSILTQSERERFVTLMSNAVQDKANQFAANNSKTQISDNAISNWYKKTMSAPGMAGTTFLALESGIEADFATAKQILGPFYPIVNIILGVAIVASLLILVASFGIDLFAIVTPAMQEEILSSGGGRSGGMTGFGGGYGGTGSSKQSKWTIGRFVSREAKQVIQDASQDNKSTGSMLMSYLGKRIIGIVAFVAFVVIVASGNLFSVIGILFDAISKMLGLA